MRKSGKNDPDCCWSKAKMAQAKQMKEQLRFGELHADHPYRSGMMSDVKDVKSVKYPGEGRGCCGVAIVTRDGVQKGVRATPLNYTNRKVVAESI